MTLPFRFLLTSLSFWLLAGITLAGDTPAAPTGSSSASLAVEVRSAAGGPVEGAEVSIELPPGAPQVERKGQPAGAAPPAARTNAEGTALFERLPVGRATVVVRAKGYADRRLKDVLLPVGVRQTLPVELTKAFALEGRVLDPAGKPVPKAEVCLRKQERSEIERANEGDADEVDEEGEAPGPSGASTPPAPPVSDAATPEAGPAPTAPVALSGSSLCAVSAEDGTVRIPTVATGAWRIAVRATGFAPLGRRMNLSTPPPKQTWRLFPGGAVSGRVLDPAGLPVAKATVTARDTKRGDPGQAPPEARTGADGRFALKNLAAGTVRVEIEPEELDRIVVDAVAIKPGAETRLGDMKARPGFPIEGRVVGPDGEPVASASVRVHEQGLLSRILRRLKTNATGRFHAAGLSPDTKLDLVVLPPKGFVPRKEEGVLPPQKNLELRLEKAGSVTGIVKAAEGEALPARLLLKAHSASEIEGATEDAVSHEADPATGRFRIEGVIPAEKVTIVATGGGFWSEPVVVAVEPGHEAGPVELELRKGSTARGSVRDASGAPIAAARVTTEGAAPVLSDAAGGFVLDGVAPGAREVQVIHPDFAPATRRQSFPLGDGGHIDIRLDRGGTIQGTVTDGDDAPVEGIVISLDEGGASAATDAAGRYEVSRVPTGPQRVRRTGSGTRDDFEVRSVEVAEGQTLTVDFRLGNILTGQLRRSGAPVAGAFLSIARPDGWDSSPGGQVSFAAQTAYTDAEGKYRLSGVTAGWATLTMIDGSQEAHKLVDVPAGREARMDVDLPDKPVRGRVVTESDGTPIAGARVFAHLGSPPGAPHSNSAMGIRMGDGDGEMVAINIATGYDVESQADGAGQFQLLLEGEDAADVSAWAQGFDQVSVKARPGQSEPVILRIGRTGKLIIHITDTAGRPVGSHMVCLITRSKGGGSGQACEFEDSGETEMAVREGPYTLTVSSPGFASKVLEREAKFAGGAGREELTVPLAPGVVLKLRLPGAGADKAKISSLKGPTGIESSSLVEDDGVDPATGDHRWHTSGLEPGEWIVEATFADGKTIRKPVTIAAGSEIEVLLP